VREYAKKLTKNDLVVMIFGDSGRAYLTKNFYAPKQAQTSTKQQLLNKKLNEKSV